MNAESEKVKKEIDGKARAHKIFIFHCFECLELAQLIIECVFEASAALVCVRMAGDIV